MDKINIKIVFRYLKERGLFLSFTKQAYSFDIENFLINNVSPQEIINQSFIWSTTKEGHEIWAKIYEDLRNLNKK